MRRMREREIEKILGQEIKKLGGRAYKWVSPGNDGVPDRIIILPGVRPIFVELKSDNGRPSTLQEVQIKKLKGLGQRVEIIKGISGLILFFQDLGYREIAERLGKKYQSQPFGTRKRGDNT